MQWLLFVRPAGLVIGTPGPHGEDYFAYLKLFEDGLWLRKYHPTPDLDFAAYLGGITEQSFLDGLAGRLPLDVEHNFLFQLGGVHPGPRRQTGICEPALPYSDA